MNNVIYYLAAEGSENLPLESGNSILLPKMYDLVWSIIPFAIILLIFAKFVLPKYSQMLQEREDRIEGGLKRAKAQQAEAKAALEKYNAQLADARAATPDDRAAVVGQRGQVAPPAVIGHRLDVFEPVELASVDLVQAERQVAVPEPEHERLGQG